MASFAVTITVQSTPDIQVFGVNITYDEILQSLGSYFYSLRKLFIESRIYSQTLQPITFENYDVNGSKKTDVISPSLDIYGKQPTLLVNLEEFNLIIDGRLIMTATVLPLGWTRFTYFTVRGDIQNGLNQYSPSNQSQIKNV